MRILRPLFVGTTLALCVLSASNASAHISLDQGGTHLSRYGDSDADIKAGPCGREGGQRGTNVYTYRPGETITVTLVEYIGHPGYFRIAFDDDGDDDFVDPQTVDPINRECMPDPADKCGETDFYNNQTVLMDNLEPHIPDFIESANYSWNVTLPNVTCDNCTLQVIQVMTDDPLIHAPYNPNEPGADDIYYQCIDLVLEGEPVGGAPMDPDAGAGGGDPGGGTGGGGGTAGETSSGGSTSANTGGTAGGSSSGGTAGAMSTGGGGAAGVNQGGGEMATGGAFGSPDGGLGASPTTSNSGGCSMVADRTTALGAGFVSLVALGLTVSRRSRRRQR